MAQEAISLEDTRPLIIESEQDQSEEDDSSSNMLTIIRNESIEQVDSNRYIVSKSIWGNLKSLSYNKRLGRFNLGVRTNREVTPTFSDSYLVTDTFEVPLSFPLFSTSISDVISANLPVSISANVSSGIRFSSTKEVSFPPSQEDLKKIAEKMSLAANGSIAGKKDFIDLTKSGKNAKLLKHFDVDPLVYARYGRVIDRVSAPIKFPMSAKKFDQFEENQVMRMAGYGTVSFGPSVGQNFSVIPTGDVLENTNIGASASVGMALLATGEFEFAVAKVSTKDKPKAWVKVTRTKGKGYTANLSANIRASINSDVLLITPALKEIKEKVSEIPVAKNFIKDAIGVSITPIHHSITRKNNAIFSVGYEFDMTHDEARKAYDQIMRGNTQMADELAIKFRSRGTKAPVVKVFSKQADQKQRVNSQTFSASLIYSKTRQCDSKLTNAIIYMGDNKYREITGESFCRINKTGILTGDKDYFFKFSSRFLFDLLKKGKRGNLSLIGEGYILDSNTSGPQLHRYIKMGKVLTGQEDILPEYPQYKIRIERNGDGDEKEVKVPIKYGLTNMAFKVALKYEQIMKFINTSDADIDRISDYAFEPYQSWFGSTIADWVDMIFIPGNLLSPDCHVCRVSGAKRDFVNNWKKLKYQIHDAAVAAETFRSMTESMIFGYAYARAIIASLEGLEYEYEFNFNNDMLANPLRVGASTTQIRDLDEMIAFEEKFTPFSLRESSYANNIVKSFGVEQAGRNFVMNFDFNKVPKFVRIRITRTGFFKKKAIDIVVPNIIDEDGTPIFSNDGPNPIKISPYSRYKFVQFIYENLEHDKSYYVRISAGNHKGNASQFYKARRAIRIYKDSK
jgi:hypothetical protein